MPFPASSAQAIVIGAGVSGLACAYYLRKLGVPALLLEQSAQPGGLIHSVKRDGFLLEEGPQSFLLTAPMMEIVRDLGMEAELLLADPRAPRYILTRNGLQRAPLAPPHLAFSSLLGARTKLSLLRDAFGHSKPPEGDESIADFVRRKFTAELLDRLAGPFVAGIYAGDPERLSLRSAFPMIHEWEARYGSVTRGAMESRQERRAGRLGSASFRQGNETLMQGLANALGDALQLNTRVESVSLDKADASPEYRLNVSHDGERRTLRSRAIVVACTTSAAAEMLRSSFPHLSGGLETVEYAPVVMLYSAFERAQVRHPLNGFGFLVPRSEKKHLLGTVWNSSLFPGRAPEGTVLFTSFAGGTTDAAFASASAESVREVLLKELGPILQIRGAPAFWAVKHYPRAIPQYVLGHAERVRQLREDRKTLPGLFLAGNYLEGPSVGVCIEEAQRAALAVRDDLCSGGA